MAQREGVASVTPEQALRVAGWCSQAEIALVTRSGVAGPLLSQAARAADGLAGGEALAAAARIARTVDLSDRSLETSAARKVVQALCRLGLHEAQEALLAARA